MPGILVVTASPAEQQAVLRRRPVSVCDVGAIVVHRASTAAGLVDVAQVGAGPVSAALKSDILLAQGYRLVLCAGIGGGFPGTEPAGVVAADRVAHADLGAETVDGGFIALPELGLGPVTFPVSADLAAELARRCGAQLGTVLTVSTVTGTQARAERLLAAHPQALAEAMEGAGVAQAAEQAGVAFGELRAISNRVGPRDRDSWRIGEALDALSNAFDALLDAPLMQGLPR